MQTNEEKAARDAAQLQEFQADPLVQCLFREGHTAPGFTMPLVAAWPVDQEQWGESYDHLLDAFRSCWEDPSDVSLQAPDQLHSALYLYSLSHLHVTIATCFRDITRDFTIDERTHLVEAWKTILQHATKLPEWPTRLRSSGKRRLHSFVEGQHWRTASRSILSSASCQGSFAPSSHAIWDSRYHSHDVLPLCYQANIASLGSARTCVGARLAIFARLVPATCTRPHVQASVRVAAVHAHSSR
jgi:hypothetical protein